MFVAPQKTAISLSKNSFASACLPLGVCVLDSARSLFGVCGEGDSAALYLSLLLFLCIFIFSPSPCIPTRPHLHYPL